MLRVLFVCLFVTKCLSQTCDMDNAVDISSGIKLPDGGIDFDNVKFKKTEYFVVDNKERACICDKKVCVLKCCPFGYAYGLDSKSCVKNNGTFRPPIRDEYLKPKDDYNLHYRFGKPNCSELEYRILLTSVYEKFHLRPDGKLYIEIPSHIPPWELRTPDKYCIDTVVSQDENGERTLKLDALTCFASEDREFYVVGPACMIISCVFILATVAVYAWLPELRNLHGRVLMAYLLCLLVGFSSLSTMQILLTVDNISSVCCIALTIIIYFSLLAAFFWLNVMSFDIWWTFSGNRGMTTEKMSIRRKFSVYTIYAFSMPTILTILLISLEFSGLPPNPFLPLLRHQGCFLYGKSRLLYLYLPMVILCVANMIFFILTAKKITEIKKETSVLKSKESATTVNQSKEKQRLLLYVKLFVIMGINWLLEVFSALYPDAVYIWHITDAYNVLIGLNIFIIFVCKKKIFYLLKKRYKQMRDGANISRSQTVCSRTLSTTRDEIALKTKTESVQDKSA
ncbi:G-protein coupled receptor Mth2-like isoform X3 [Aricia agestis]|uniref:G-protein coupled receptor Mth2-like isoform X3 n=1 Tax=Aricia agestis TaxID=91739 RepID=UPI001C20BB9A|nr:G-protein coupled receptor Mth2-like isoform X3 [Aricia agestis]